MARSLNEDPLTLACLPPPNESEPERRAREAAEAEARRVSDEIDEALRKERLERRRKKKPVKVLLLGQSESGKTATLKNFQLTYARREWYAERASWRCVIQLNLVRNVNTILDVLAREITAAPTPSEPGSDSDSDGADGPPVRARPRSESPLTFTEKHRLLKLRLGPLRRVQLDLERRLGAASSEVYVSSVSTAAPFDNMPAAKKSATQEFSIHSTNGWKTALDKFRSLRGSPGRTNADNLDQSPDGDDDTTDVIAGCRDDMKAIWEDPIIQQMLTRRKTRIEDAPGFFLADCDRIAVRNYQPLDGDILRARLRTTGVQEHKFVFDHGRTMGQEWILYDVGGTRSSRAAWYSYFDDVDAIIFLAPISCFDEKLAEDRRVNRLEDSYLLWKSVCACKLLARTQLILFLNKCDLLQAKLMRGVRVRDHISSFGDRRNDLAVVTKYFQQHFKDISKQHSPVARPFYVHLTSVIDMKSTAVTLGAVEESILRDHLRRADLM